MSKSVNMDPLKKLVTEEIDAADFAKVLDEIGHSYGQAALSQIDDFPPHSLAEHLYWLRELRNRFLKVAGNETFSNEE